VNVYFASLRTAVDASTVVLLAATGEMFTERLGVLNLSQEGLIGIGAAAAVIAANSVGSPWLCLLIGAAAGALMGLAFALSVVVVRANQVLCGLAFALLGIGLSNQLGNGRQGSPVESVFRPVKIPGLADIPQIGPALFNHDLVVYLTYLALPAIAAFVLYRTRHGMNLRSVGENPAAADAVGINVTGMRLAYTTAGAALSGAGGAFLMLSFTPVWSENVARGRGWVALAVVIFAAWRPWLLVAGSLLYGAMISLEFRAQSENWGIPPLALSMLPYLVTLVLILIPALAARLGRRVRATAAPGALGVPYFREER
jgi:general nucleoside transport system permease protein